MRISDWSADVCSTDLRLLTKKDIGDVIDQVYRHTGQKDTVLFADAIMALGFRHAFQAGISFGKDDMIIPESKVGTVDETRALVADYEQSYQVRNSVVYGQRFHFRVGF